MSSRLNKLFGDKQVVITDDAVHPVSVTDDDFETVVLGSQTPVIVDFWAPWCMPCRMMTPILEQFGADEGGNVKICKVNTDENQRIAAQYGIMSIPSLLFFHNGEEVGRTVGVQPAHALKAALDKVMQRSV